MKFLNLFFTAGFLSLSIFASEIHAQTCSGSLGAPIFIEDFGKNITTRTQLGASGTSTYCFDQMGCTSGSADPNLPSGCSGSGSTPTREQIDDNEYAIIGDIKPTMTPNTYGSGCFVTRYIGASHPLNAGWHNNIEDHTAGDTNGGMGVFNASLTANEFYRRTVTGLCGGTTFEFSSWLANMYDPGTGICSGTGLPVNVLFEVRHPVTQVLLASVSSGNIQGSNTFTWNKYAITFTVPVNLTSVILVMRNNANGGCGNDLAVDDIEFRACGPLSDITPQSSVICPMDTVSLAASISPGFSDPYFIWQKYDEATQVWNNAGMEGASSLGFDTVDVIASRNGDQYRYHAAGDSAAAQNPNCPIISNQYRIETLEIGVAMTENIDSICSGDTITFLATIPGSINSPGSSVGSAPYDFKWYDPNGLELEAGLHNGITVSEDSIIIYTAGFDAYNNDWSVGVTDDDGCSHTDTIRPTFNLSCFTLPVDFLYFDGTTLGSEVILKWGTAMEINNSHFAVEYSTDGVSFRELATVQGNGSSQNQHDYIWIHSNPGAINYYRLKQEDFNGVTDYTEVIMIRSGNAQNKVKMYPNPVRLGEDVTILKSGPVDLSIYSSDGRLVDVQKSETESAFILKTHTLKAGIYHINISGMETQRLIILK